jgi:hypothetical protein
MKDIYLSRERINQLMARMIDCEMYFNFGKKDFQWEDDGKYVIYTNGALSQEELDFIFPEETIPEYNYVKSYIHWAKVNLTLHKGSIAKIVGAALKSGFLFEPEDEARKWNSGKNFRMFRKGIKLVKKVKYDPLTLKMFRKEIKLVKQEEYDPLTKKFQEMMLEMNEDEFSSLIVDAYFAASMI